MRQIGILQALVSGLCFGFLGIFGKWAYQAELRPGEFLALRFVVAASVLGILLALFSRSSLRLPKKVIFQCLLLGIMGYALFSSCYFYALEGLSASLTVLLLYTYPVYVTLASVVFLKEKFRLQHGIALPVMGVGMAALVWGEMAIRSSTSLAFGFLSALFYSVYILISSRVIRGHSAYGCVFFIMMGAGITLSLLHLRAETFPIASLGWMAVGGASLISTIVAMALFLAALQKITNTETALLSTAEPLSGVLLASLFLGESFSPLQWMGGFLLISGMTVVALAKLEKGER